MVTKMAQMEIHFYSEQLKKNTTFQLLLPNDFNWKDMDGNPHYQRNTKVLYLLHGYSGSSVDWLTGGAVRELSRAYNIAVVMPSGDNSFYLNGKGAGRAYGRFIGEELTAYVKKTFGLSDKKEDTYIGGLSMGGFGAIHLGLAYPDTFGKVFGLSSALVVDTIKNMKPGCKDAVADYDYYESVFGDLDQLDESESNPKYLLKKRKKEGKRIPPFYMACGTEDVLLKNNREFRDFLINEQANLCYQESAGDHDWKFWNANLEPAVVWALSE